MAVAAGSRRGWWLVGSVGIVVGAAFVTAFFVWRAHRYPSRLPVTCPPRAPWAGDPCGRKGLTCEYGRMGWEPGCSELFRCERTGRWAELADPDESSCQIADAGVSPECTPSHAAVPRGAACASPVTCDYAEGRCACTLACVKGDAGRRVLVDGGTWFCDDPAPDCPRPRPTLGSPCASEGQRCSYEVCCVGVELECREGLWWALLVNTECEGE